MNDLFSDLWYSLRLFGRARAFYALVVLILALGIASSVSIFSLVDGVLLRPLPYTDPQRLVTLTTVANKPPFDSNGSVSYHDFLQIQSKAHSFSEVAVTFRTGWSRITLTGEGEPVTMQGAFVSPDFFRTFGRAPILGRTFTAEENRRAERVLLIGAGLWAQRFGSAPDVVGRDLSMDHLRWRVIGVMPSDFQVPFLDTQVWAPVLSHPEWNSTEQTNPLDRPRWDLFARLRPGVNEAAAQAEVASLWKGLRTALPDFHTDDLEIVPLRRHFTSEVRKPLLILLSAVCFLLLIALANVANLFLARSSQRRRELAIRTALGARKARIIPAARHGGARAVVSWRPAGDPSGGRTPAAAQSACAREYTALADRRLGRAMPVFRRAAFDGRRITARHGARLAAGSGGPGIAENRRLHIEVRPARQSFQNHAGGR